jgi:hypothetical protein
VLAVSVMILPPEIIAPRDRHGSKLGNVIRRLSSNNDGELVATVHAMRRVLESVGADVHALAEHLEKPNNGGLNEAEARKVFDAGYAMGVQDAENKQHGANDFRTPMANRIGATSRCSYSGTSIGSIASTTNL